MGEEFDTDNMGKSVHACINYKEIGNELFIKGDFHGAAKNYTTALLHAPPVYDSESFISVAKDYSLGMLFANRSAAAFRLKEYTHCVQDISRAVACGNHNSKRYFKIMSRLAWSYWHLKQYELCDTTVQKILNCQQVDFAISEEQHILQSLLLKVNAGNNDKGNNSSMHNEGDANPWCNASPGIFDNVKTLHDDVKGRYLVSTQSHAPSDVIFEEVAFCGVLNEEFEKTHCTHCFKECMMFGIPCFGCTTSLYCDEACRNAAWSTYHWLECCMSPVLDQVDIFCRVALRTVLTGAHELFTGEHGVCTLIAKHIKETHCNSKNQSCQNKAKPHENSIRLDGCDPGSGKYKGDYWSVYCLQTHAANHSKLLLSRCSEIARVVARVIEHCIPARVVASELDGNKRYSSESVRLKQELKHTLNRISFQAIQQRNSPSYSFDIQSFRANVRAVSARFADKVSNICSKQQTRFSNKDLPKTFSDILAYLLKHHMLQLYTNSLAVITVVSDQHERNSVVATTSQRRVAACIFPCISLMNHSCDSNTILSFCGNKVKVKALSSIDRGGEVSHCYGPCVARHSLKDRQNMLKRQYYFECHCQACTSQMSGDQDQQAYIAQFTAYKCAACNGPVTILDSDGNGAVWGKCVDQACKKLHNLTKPQLLFEQTLERANQASRAALKKISQESLKVLSRCLEDFESILYKHHQAMAAIHDQIAYCYSHMGKFVDAIPHVLHSLKVVSMKYGPRSMEAARETHKLATLYFKTSQFDLAGKHIFKVLPVFRALLPEKSVELAEAEEMNRTLEILLRAKCVSHKS